MRTHGPAMSMLSSYSWRVVPLSEAQLLDVNPKDVLGDGAFRRCNTYRGGGGYDRFPTLADRYCGESHHHLQFVIQLFGCNLDCPYCYVTREGVWGRTRSFTTHDLIMAFNESDCSVFHLMGGAPALLLKRWPLILQGLNAIGKRGWLFHSDLMLTEGCYDSRVLAAIADARALYAVNIKGVTDAEFQTNTRKQFDADLLWMNLVKIEQAKVPYYITFTNIAVDSTNRFWNQFQRRFGIDLRRVRERDAFHIELVNYEALPFVDRVPWGGRDASIRRRESRKNS